MRAADRPDGDAVPAWLALLFDEGLLESWSRLGWGFRNETWRVTLADGRRLAISRLVDIDAGPAIVSLTHLVEPRVRAAGVPAPRIVDLEAPATGILVTEFVDGTPGAALLDEPGGPALVGALLGGAWRRLADVDTRGLPLPTTWADPDNLVSASLVHMEGLGRWLTEPDRRHLSDAIARLPDLVADRRPGFVHGDLVPVNVIVRDGTLAALLDFEFARLADPLLDAAWFDLILAFHHPAEEPAAWAAFIASAELDAGDPATRDVLRLLPQLRLLEILDDERLDEEAAGHWIDLLRTAMERSA